MSLTTFALCVDACFLPPFSFRHSCIGNLVCFQRDGGTPVPGCNGNSSTRNDYCIDPNDLIPHPTPTSTTPHPPPPTPPSTPSLVPQPTPTTGSGGGGGGGGGNLLKVKLIDSDPPPSALPLGECEGDCDNDNQVCNKNGCY